MDSICTNAPRQFTPKTGAIATMSTSEIQRLYHSNLGTDANSSSRSTIANLPVIINSVTDPRDRIWKCVRTIKGHSDWVRSLAISPDGETLASGSFDGTIKLWRLSSGELIDTLSEHSKGVFCVALSNDGQTLASGSWDETIKVWQPKTQHAIRTLSGHCGSVRAIAISPDNQTLFSASTDATIKLWHIKTGKLIDTLASSAEPIYAIALSHYQKLPSQVGQLDRQILACGGGDGLITLWALDTREQVGVLTGNLNQVWAIVIAPDNQRLACASGDGTIKIWQRD